MAVGAISFWNEWAIQFSVLASLALQLLLLLAKIRRFESSCPPFRWILWLAYQLADVAATSALGLCLGATPHDHLLVAFWAQFLLLHLGGPDNITAYALEDNKLWKRHGLNLLVQVSIAIYVVYKHYIGTDDLLRPATILMCIVGVLKYSERTYALNRSNMDNIRSSLMKELPPKCHFYLEDKAPQGAGGFKVKVDEEEFLMRHAHSLFHICKHAIVDSSVDNDEDNPEIKVLDHLTNEQKYVVMELELSLMYDILYTKASVVHTYFGYCIRIISSAATTAALLLFQFSDKDGHNSVDVAITYILLGCALLLEIISLLSALGSSWTFPFLCGSQRNWLQHAVMCRGRWERLRRWVVSLHWFIKVMRLARILGSARRWSGTVGQYNMLYLCSRPRNSPLVGKFANMLGLGELWDREHYSWSVKFPGHLKHWLMQYIDALVRNEEVSTQGIVREKWGYWPLKMCNLYKDLEVRLGVEFQEGIIIWHIATDLFLDMSEKAAKFRPMEDKSLYEEAIRLLSNYLMFLLVKRPYMLPGLGQSKLYRRTCQNLDDIWCKKGEERLVLSNLLRLYDDPNSLSSLGERKQLGNMVMKERKDVGAKNPRLPYAVHVAEVLVKNDMDENRERDSLWVLLHVWMDFLIHAANRGSRESHAKKLSSGGEFTTIIWLLIEHIHQLVPSLQRHKPEAP